jgi:hypothetical protein
MSLKDFLNTLPVDMRDKSCTCHLKDDVFAPARLHKEYCNKFITRNKDRDLIQCGCGETICIGDREFHVKNSKSHKAERKIRKQQKLQKLAEKQPEPQIAPQIVKVPPQPLKSNVTKLKFLIDQFVTQYNEIADGKINEPIIEKPVEKLFKNTKYLCECNEFVSHKAKHTHLQSIRHINYLTGKDVNENGKARRYKKILCECEGTYLLCNKKKHTKSKKHMNYIFNNR